jgi:asparagine synthase (glutamine-hydrolysing)
MSGVFGIFSHSLSRISEQLTIMGQEMSHRPWYHLDVFCDESQGVGLGRIGIGIFNQAPQPLWNSDRTVALVMTGEIYNRNELIRNDLITSDEQIVLSLYEQLKDEFIGCLKGAFVIAIWDKNRNQLLIANDRLGLYPLHYAHYNDKLVFAPEMKGILCDPTFRKELDMAALAEYMHFQYLLGDKTFFKELKLLPGASILCYNTQSGHLTIRPYWDFSRLPQLPPTVVFEEAVEEASRLLKTAVNRFTGGNHRAGIYLSGGLDSRMILGAIAPDLLPVTTITFGQQGCRDVIYARQIAALIGADHHYFEFPDGKWVEKFADFHLELTEGFHSWIHSHGISILDQVRSLIDINLTGFWGEAFAVDNEMYLPLLQAPDNMAFTVQVFNWYSQKITWPSMSEVEKQFLFSPRLSSQMQNLAFESFSAELAKYDHLSYEQRSLSFYVNNISRRMYQYYTIFQRSHFELRFPFCDYDYMEFIGALPVEMGFKSRIRRAMLLNMNKSLGSVPYDKDNLPITQGKLARVTAKLVQKSKSFVNRHVAVVFPEYKTLYTDYENWLRNELGSWAEGLLLGERTLQRDIFNPEFLQSLWRRHLLGLEEWTIGKIAPIMTYEMMLRRFYD